MIKIYFFLITVFIFQQTFSQDTVPYNKYYDDGQLKTTGQLLVGERVGEWKDYHANGQLSTVYSYTEGERNKKYISYYENAVMSHETTEVMGEYISKEYYKNGVLRSERGLDGGYFKGYQENGSLQIESYYNNGELEGIWKQYYDSGELEWQVDYVDGYRQGSYQNYYKNGKIKLDGKMVEDKKEGKENRFLENGQIEWSGSYKDDLLDNKWIHFDTNGNEIEKIKYNSGIIKDSNTTINLTSTIVPDGVIERVPIFPGCETLLGNRMLRKCMSEKITLFVTSNFNANVVAKSGVSLRQSISGLQRINILFKIATDGTITDIKAHASHNVLEEEAIRVIKMLPKLEPGTQKGIPVIVPYALPIVFQYK